MISFADGMKIITTFGGLLLGGLMAIFAIIFGVGMHSCAQESTANKEYECILACTKSPLPGGSLYHDGQCYCGSREAQGYVPCYFLIEGKKVACFPQKDGGVYEADGGVRYSFDSAGRRYNIKD